MKLKQCVNNVVTIQAKLFLINYKTQYLNDFFLSDFSESTD